tara:strand:- start:25897 stop:26868 length:972 start_codon:yes stop_codon:yes gene_type:complete
MAKTKVSQWDSVAANNTDINTININEGCPPSTINNAIRETMAQIKNWQDGSSGDGWTSSGTITSSGVFNVTGSFTVDAATGTAGQVLTSSGSAVTPTWTSLGTMSTQSSSAVAITGGAIATTGALNVTGSLTMDGATGSNGQLLTSGGSSATPTWTSLVSFTTGMIILWSGSVGTIPSGWALCNGSSGTPDLRNRFVVGAGSTYSPNNTGGSATATLPAHTHTASTSTTGAHAHSGSTNTVAAHVHSIQSVNTGFGATTPGILGGAGNIGSSYNTNAANAHAHTVSIPSSGTHNHTVSVASAGTSATNANLPPYYALAYIMKL